MHLVASERSKSRKELDASGRSLVQIDALGTFGRVVTLQRARRGTFEWMSAQRRWSAAQEQAGRRARSLWEAIHRGPIQTANMEAIGGQPGCHGPQESILEAMQRAKQLVQTIGMLSEARLRRFLLDDVSIAELAISWRWSSRDMSAVLKADLDAAAMHFGFDPRHMS